MPNNHEVFIFVGKGWTVGQPHLIIANYFVMADSGKSYTSGLPLRGSKKSLILAEKVLNFWVKKSLKVLNFAFSDLVDTL